MIVGFEGSLLDLAVSHSLPLDPTNQFGIYHIPSYYNISKRNCTIFLYTDLGGSGGGVTILMARRTMATTPRITSTEMKMPFQSRDLVGIETSSWRLKILVTDHD